jgi:hypothetical protein
LFSWEKGNMILFYSFSWEEFIDMSHWVCVFFIRSFSSLNDNIV